MNIVGWAGIVLTTICFLGMLLIVRPEGWVWVYLLADALLITFFAWLLNQA